MHTVVIIHSPDFLTFFLEKEGEQGGKTVQPVSPVAQVEGRSLESGNITQVVKCCVRHFKYSCVV